MQYILLIHEDEGFYRSADKAAIDKRMGAYMAYTTAMKEAGVLRGGERLQPVTTASTVRVRNGKNEVLDGPYAETKEQFGGFFVIDAPDLDKALEWAARCPGAAAGAIEVRPIWQMS